MPTGRFDACAAFMESGFDRARADDRLTSGRILLGLLAVRYLCTKLDDSDAWRMMRHELVHATSAQFRAEEAIRQLAHLVESHEPTLRGVLNDGVLSDLLRFESLLAYWIVELDLLGFPPGRGGDHREFGRLFDTLIDSLVTRGSAAMQSTTPRHIADLMVRLADPREGHRLLDPCCGVGTCLASAAVFRSSGVDLRFNMAGQEIDNATAALAKLRLFFLTGTAPPVEVGDALRRPGFLRNERMETFDRVFLHPPQGQRFADTTFVERDSLGRFRWGRPSRTSSESAFIQHALAYLAPHGRAVALIAHGFLLRGASDGVVRRNLVLDDLIDAVIGLPSGSVPGVPVELAILVLRRDKPPERQRLVMFIDGSNHRGVARDAAAWARLSNDIEVAYRAGIESAGLARGVTSQAIEDAGFSLQPRRYVGRAPTPRPRDVKAALVEAQALEAAASGAAAEIDRIIQRFQLAPPEPQLL